MTAVRLALLLSETDSALGDALKGIEGVEVVLESPYYSASVLQRVISAKPDAVVVSDNLPGDGDLTILAAIRSLRSADLRVIFVGGEDRRRGDPLLAALVQIGVYDFLLGGEITLHGLKRLLREPTPFSAVADYLVDTVPPPARTVVPETKPEPSESSPPDTPHPPGRRVVVARPVVIAVGGVAARVGATHTALAAASYLARRGYRVALVEACERPALAWLLHRLGLDPGLGRGGSEMAPGLVVYTQPVAGAVPGLSPDQEGRRRVAEVLAEEPGFEYVVADLGRVAPDDPELWRADLAVAVASGAPWLMRELEEWLRKAPGTGRLRVVVTPAEEVPADLLGLDVTGHAIPLVPFEPVPTTRHSTPTADQALAGLLGPVLPDAPARSPARQRLLMLSRRMPWQGVAATAAVAVLVYLAVGMSWAVASSSSPPAVLRPVVGLAREFIGSFSPR